MLWVVMLSQHRQQIERVREHFGGEFRRNIRTIWYETLRYRTGLPGGAYLFCNQEMLESRQFERAGRLAAVIREHAPAAPLLNDPRRVMRRYELNRALFCAGINSFDVYRADEHRTPSRWPVFVRREMDHRGAAANLIAGPDKLATVLVRDRLAGRDFSRRMVVEFEDTRDEDGQFREYSALRVGDRIIPAHVHCSDQWMVKLPKTSSPEGLAEEERYVADNPHAEELMRIFDLAGYDYGRIDYGVGKNGIEVWEINSNPSLISGRNRGITERWERVTKGVLQRLGDALLECARAGEGQPRIPAAALHPICPRYLQRLLRYRAP